MPALPKAAEAHLAGGGVYDGVVNTAAAKAAAQVNFSAVSLSRVKMLREPGDGGMELIFGWLHPRNHK